MRRYHTGIVVIGSVLKAEAKNLANVFVYVNLSFKSSNKEVNGECNPVFNVSVSHGSEAMHDRSDE